MENTHTALGDVQKQVQATIDHLVETGVERGVQVAVYRHGKLVVDAVAGVADTATGRLVTSDTPFYSTSTGKGVTASLVHVLVERGVFGYDTRIAELWPAFGAHGKKKATVRHALTHTVGVPGVPPDTTPEDLCNWDKMCAAIADATPWWEPGTSTGYHAQTFGYIIGEVVRRATGKRISEILRDDVAGPLGIARELYFGVPSSELPRLARLEEAEGNLEMLASIPTDSPFFKAAPPAVQPTAEFCNRADILSSDIPAGSTLSARAVARVYAALMDDVDGVRLISSEHLREVTSLAFSGVDELMGNPAQWGLGYALGRPGQGPAKSPTWFGMAGSGGTAAYADTATGLAIAVTKTTITYGQFNAFGQVVDIVTQANAR